MWLSALIALITYLLSPKGNSAERRQALLNAGLAGGGTYLATQYTDWGKDLSSSFDSAIGVAEKPAIPASGSIAASGATLDANGNVITTPVAGAVGAVNKTPAAGGSLWSTISSWGPGVTALAAGTAGAVLGSGISVGTVAIVGVLAYFVLRKPTVIQRN